MDLGDPGGIGSQHRWRKGSVTVGADGRATFTDALEGDVPAEGRHGYSVLHAGSTVPSTARHVVLQGRQALSDGCRWRR